MILINGITATPFQSFWYSITGGTIYFTLYYRPAVRMWFADIEYNNFAKKGIRLCQSYNLLYQFDKIIPFGISVDVKSGPEPVLINDFSTGRVQLNILDSDELVQLREQYMEWKDEVSSI